MKKILLIISIIFLTACSNTEPKSEALDYLNKPAIKIKSPEEWFELVNKASKENDNIATYLDTQTCIPTKSLACAKDKPCVEAEPSVFFFVSSFDPKTGTSSSYAVYHCSELGGCEKNGYTTYMGKDGILRLQGKNREILIEQDDTFNETITFGTNLTTNSGKCYYRDSLKIAEAKVENINKMDDICEISESNFGIDSMGVNGVFTLKNETELRASPIVMDCNVRAMVPKGEKITIQTLTDGAVNDTDKFIWLRIKYDGFSGWIRGDYLDDQFKR